MSKKEENKRNYFEAPLPPSESKKRLTRLEWGGLNMRYATDTGDLSYEKNISTAEYPSLTPSAVWKHMSFSALGGLSAPTEISSDAIFAFDDELIAFESVKSSSGSGTSYCLCFYNAGETELTLKYRADITAAIPNYLYRNGHSLVKCVSLNTNVDDFTAEPSEDYYLFPEAVKIQVTRGNGYTISGHTAYSIDSPNFETATAHLGRLFGTYKSNVYASNFNKFGVWTFDTVDETNASNAWASTTQSNSAAGTDFTGIVSFQNHVVGFKDGFMHEIYNTQNPFRVTDVYAEGTMNGRSIREVGGVLIFASKKGVRAYTGSKPKDLGYKLGINEITNAVAGTDGRLYYLFCAVRKTNVDESAAESEKKENRLFVYDSLVGEWSEERFDTGNIISFAETKNGLYALTSEGDVFRKSNVYSHNWAFETDFITSGTIDVKRVKKVQLRADISEGSQLKIYLLKDAEPFDVEKSQKVYDSAGRTGAVTAGILVRGTASKGFKLHFEGYGYVKIHEMEIDLSKGGEMYV